MLVPSSPPHRRQPPRARHRCWVLALAGLLLAAALLAACGDQGDGDATRALERFVALGLGANLSTTVEHGTLPQDFPSDFPNYQGARVVTSIRGSGEGGTFYLVIMETSDDREAVLAFYEEELNRGPWQVTAARADRKANVLQFQRVGEPPLGGGLMIEAHRPGGKGSDITLSLFSEGGAESAKVGETAPRPEEGLPLPHGFPADFPLHPTAVITDTAWLRGDGEINYVVRFLTPEREDDIILFYEDNLAKGGWAVAEEFTDEDGFNIAFVDAVTQQPAGLIITRPSPKFADYVEVTLQITVQEQ